MVARHARRAFAPQARSVVGDRKSRRDLRSQGLIMSKMDGSEGGPRAGSGVDAVLVPNHVEQVLRSCLCLLYL